MSTSDCDIICWKQKYRNDFIRLNREWIERYFRLEPCDLKILGNPEAEIIDKGGEIFFAVENDAVIGARVHWFITPIQKAMNWQRWPFRQQRKVMAQGISWEKL